MSLIGSNKFQTHNSTSSFLAMDSDSSSFDNPIEPSTTSIGTWMTPAVTLCASLTMFSVSCSDRLSATESAFDEGSSSTGIIFSWTSTNAALPINIGEWQIKSLTWNSGKWTVLEVNWREIWGGRYWERDEVCEFGELVRDGVGEFFWELTVYPTVTVKILCLP